MQLVDQDEVALFIGCSVRTLEVWRHKKIGPPFFRVGGRFIRYDLDKVKAWSTSKEVQAQSSDV